MKDFERRVELCAKAITDPDVDGQPAHPFGNDIDGEVQFKANNGSASGKKIYVQLKIVFEGDKLDIAAVWRVRDKVVK